MPPFPAAAARGRASAAAAASARASGLRRTSGHSMAVSAPGDSYRASQLSGRRVRLPSDVPAPFAGYRNGVAQRAGSDYRVDGDLLVFAEPIAREGRLGTWRWLSMLLGVAGTYRKHDSVDVVYEREGARAVATGLPLV